ncbi:hypothetical protein COLO4_36313 [Corchorus olitorius]|uniref:Uncharacterized protein n=1 Tax=Corchorus olitorius TaxID=93759 RepID=A0A1R3GA35_9ROSI|nr:hypothetical protein COLO4_36313 [Corchorus olitorius]
MKSGEPGTVWVILGLDSNKARLPFDLARALPLNPVFDGPVENCCVRVRGEESWQGKNS